MTDTSDTVQTQGVLGNTKTKTLRARGWCFTLNNWTSEEKEKLETYGHTHTVRFVIGQEVGSKKGTEHLQGYFYHKNAVTFIRMKKLSDRAHWEVSKGSPEQNFTYCTKDNDFIQKGFEKKPVFKDELAARLLKKYDGVVWKEWQQNILAKIEEVPDARTINWVCDYKGNSGKSYLTKYITLTNEVIIADGKKDNIFNQVNRKLNEEEKEFKVVLLDIPRSAEGYINYGVLEQLKNGLIYSGKYEGGQCLFDDVHVVVFANFMPDRSQFSEDRWNIIQLDET